MIEQSNSKQRKILDAINLKDFIIDILEDKQADNIIVIDLTSKMSIAQFIIFASGRSTKNVAAIAEILAQELKSSAGVQRVNIEGLGQAEWVLIDTGEIITHIFHPAAREHFKLENLWQKKVDELDD